ncbi:hypothetical protein N431DRAFT_477853 [Stipitochalara longipes BDJ]|nr:hypothetical protein N431DRAFT_477853 [Stipitochalara longipes BDJ]
MEDEHAAAPAIDVNDMVPMFESGAEVCAIEQSDPEVVSVEGSEGEDADVETSDTDGFEIEDAADREDWVDEISEAELSDVEVSGTDGSQVDNYDDLRGYGYFSCYVIEVFPSALTLRPAQLQTFKLFPKLPIEIRHMIWRATFRPRRHVWSFEDGSGPCCRRIGLTHPPIALFINKESREEALRCYVQLDEGPQRCRGYVRRTPFVFFNMKLATLRVASPMVHAGEIEAFCKVHFQKTHLEILGQIRYLEIEEWRFEGDHDSPIRSDATNFKDFKGLKQLKFIPTATWEILTVQGERSFANGYKDYFAKLAAENPARTIPDVIIGEKMDRDSMCTWYCEM